LQQDKRRPTTPEFDTGGEVPALTAGSARP
jgi:hypothetical protein